MCWQRRLWRVCTFTHARMSLRHSTKISCAGSNGNLCTVYVSSKGCGDSAPATTPHVCNNQCVVSKRQKCPQCIVIEFLNKTFASLQKMKKSFFISWEYEAVHEISNNVVCATSKASDQPAHTRSLFRALASRLSIL